jgi:2-iminobutanoate/2-iminopropanoate deaminase
MDLDLVEHNPIDGIYPADDYIHALEVRNPQRFLYLAGTMGLRPDWSAGKDVDEQLELVWNNIRAILKSAGMGVDNIVRQTSYLRDRAYMEKNANARVTALGGRKIPTITIVAETLMDDWLIEIEIVAAA